jgi:WD40 repeat protein
MSSAPDTPENRPPPHVSDHILLRRIGQGSFGEVWLARNLMGMYRAVKIVYRSSFQDRRPFERELAGVRNFEPISRSHEGFVDVLHAGMNEERGFFYYVMELGDDVVSGQNIDPATYSPKTLSKAIRAQGKLAAEDALQLGLTLSLAVAELHKHGLVHRDIKPSNIIFVNGVPKLADIGLVTNVQEAASFGGTEGFIPPEGPGSPQADVYGLGKVLYEACTGLDRLKFPALPASLTDASSPEHGLFLELNEVVLEACQGSVSNRFSSAWEMHARLLVIANGGSVRRLRALERRWARFKHAGGIAAVALLAVMGYGLWAYRQYQSAVEYHERRVASNLSLGNRALDTGDLPGSLPYFAEAVDLDHGNANREREDRLRFGSTLAQCPKIVQMWFLRGEIKTVGFSARGDQVLATEREGKAYVFDVESGRTSSQFGQEGSLWRGGFSPDGKYVVTTSFNGTACVWRASDGTNVLRLVHSNWVTCASFSPDGSRLVTGCYDKIVRVWSVTDGKLQLELPGHTGNIRHVAFSPNGRRIVTCSEDGTARIWDASDGHPLLAPIRHPHWVMYAAFSPDGQTLATAAGDHKVRFWKASTGERIPPDLEHKDWVETVEYSPDGRLVLTASLDGTVRLWQADDHQPVKKNPVLRHSDRVLQAAFSPDSHRLVTGCYDGTVRVWDLAGSLAAPKPVQAIFSEDKSHFLTLSNGSLQVWDSLSGREASPVINAEASEATLSKDGRFAVSLLTPPDAAKSNRSTARTWDTQTGKLVGPPITISTAITNLVLSKDGRRLVCFLGKHAQSWDLISGKMLAPAVMHDSKVRSAIWNPAGDVVASWDSREVRVWTGSTGEQLFEPIHLPVPVQYVEFSPSGSQFVTCGADPGFTKCWAQVWNTRTGKAVGQPLKHQDGVRCARFSPDEKKIVTASEDFTAVVWDVVKGTPLAPAVMHRETITAATFSPDSQWVVTASVDKTARVWSGITGDPLTPELLHPDGLGDARFLADPCRLVTSDGAGNYWSWKLSLDQRPFTDLVALARLLSGDTVAPWGTDSRHEQPSLEAIWRRLRQLYPEDFTTSSEEIAAWHEGQAEECEREQNWGAATFHLTRCLALRPNDSLLSARLAGAQTHLAGNQ